MMGWMAPGLHQQAGHMTASDLCAARHNISCQAGPSTHEPAEVVAGLALPLFSQTVRAQDRK